jgi:muconolactone delta-isomerase
VEGKVLFLVRREVKNLLDIPQDHLDELRVQTFTWAMKQIREKKILVSRGVPGTAVAYIFFNTSSAAELKLLLSKSPLAPYQVNEVIPLIPIEEGLQSATRLLEESNAKLALRAS